MLPTAEGRPRRIKMVPASGSQHLPESGRPGQPRGCHFGGGRSVNSALRVASLLPASLQCSVLARHVHIHIHSAG